MSAIWAWFLGTKFGRLLLALLAVILAFAATALAAFERGKHKQAQADEAKDAAEQVKQAQSGAETYQKASDAASKVRQDAAKLPAPDTKNRTDFDNEF